MKRFSRRPELAAGAGLVAVLLFFALVAGDSGMFTLLGLLGIFEVSAELALIAVPVAMLMIGGEFDLSVGAVIAFSSMSLALLLDAGLTHASAVLFTLSLAAVVGAANGWLVVRTRLPSFIVTLASMFVLRGATLGGTRALTGRTALSGLRDLDGDTVSTALSGAPLGLPVSVLWASLVLSFAAYVLHRTPFGNWTFAVGGDERAAASVGVPVARVKILLFMGTALAAALLATLQVLDTGSADTNRGLRDEFEAIIAAVIGGNLLSGGYGSVLGAALGALLFGVVQMGIFHTGADTDWFELFLGVMLLTAVVLNESLRRRSEAP